jgi:2-dehydro-3-deoxyglucarate aldolase
MKMVSNVPMIGSWLCSGSPVIAELMALCGFSFVTIDVEHSPIDIEGTFRLMQAVKSANPECKAFVRVASANYSEIKRYMDAGANGIICPMINTKEEAQILVDAVKYYPLGKRGIGYSRSNRYGLDLKEAIENDNNRTFVCVQIEHFKAIDNLEDILSVPGIDAAFIGPYDLSASMGLTGEFNHPRMKQAISKVLDVCEKKNITPGIHIVDPDIGQVTARIDQGYRLIAFSVDITMISTMAKKLFLDLDNKQ